MDIASIKQLIKNGHFPEARDQLGQILEQTPDDTVAQMLYGTCCQIMGDAETFGRIYQRLALEMDRCVERGEKSERTRMWLKYAAMFAMLLMCGTQIWAQEDNSATLANDDAPAVAMPTNGENDEFERVMKMPLKEKFRHFLQIKDVKEQLHKGRLRAVVIPLQSPKEYKEQENLLIIARKLIQNGADVVQDIKAMSKKTYRYGLIDDDDDEDFVRAVPKTNSKGGPQEAPLFAVFSPFEKIARTDDGGATNTSGVWRPREFGSVEQMDKGLKKTIECIETQGDISDLIVSSEDPGWLILGICFVNVHGKMGGRAKYAGPRDYGDRFPRRVVTPQGKVIYELTEEMVRKEMEKERERWERPPSCARYAGPGFSTRIEIDNDF